MSYAAFFALVLDLIGSGNAAAGTWSACLLCLGYASIAYMEYLDRIGYKLLHAPQGMLGADALLRGIASAPWLAFALHRAPEAPFRAARTG